MCKRNYFVDYSIYSFKADDKWGCFKSGEKNEPKFKKTGGYAYDRYVCNDGKTHTMDEHVVKWEYFNGKIPDGYEVDHIIPIKNGGTNELSNLRIVTHKKNCNNEITRKNYSDSRKGEKHPFYGKHRSEETKKKISNSKKGMKRSDEWLKKMINNPSMSKGIVGIDEHGKEICKFQSVQDAVRNGYSSHCGEVANGKRIRSDKLYWKWIN